MCPYLDCPLLEDPLYINMYRLTMQLYYKTSFFKLLAGQHTYTHQSRNMSYNYKVSNIWDIFVINILTIQEWDFFKNIFIHKYHGVGLQLQIKICFL